MKKIRLIQQVLCEYGNPIQHPGKSLTKEIRIKAIQRAKQAFAEYQNFSGEVEEMLEHPAPRIYNLKGRGCFYRYQGANFVRCLKTKAGRVILS